MFNCMRGFDPRTMGRCEHGSNCGQTDCRLAEPGMGLDPQRVEFFLDGVAATVFLQQGDALMGIVEGDFDRISRAMDRVAAAGHLPKL